MVGGPPPVQPAIVPRRYMVHERAVVYHVNFYSFFMLPSCNVREYFVHPFMRVGSLLAVGYFCFHPGLAAYSGSVGGACLHRLPFYAYCTPLPAPPKFYRTKRCQQKPGF